MAILAVMLFFNGPFGMLMDLKNMQTFSNQLTHIFLMGKCNLSLVHILDLDLWINEFANSRNLNIMIFEPHFKQLKTRSQIYF